MSLFYTLIIKMSNWKQHLSSLYFNSKIPASYLGPEKLYQIVKSQGKYKIDRHRIRKWLQDQESFFLTRGARRKYTRSRVIVAGIGICRIWILWILLTLPSRMTTLIYMLVAIDIFSRFAHCQPVKSKKGSDVLQALKRVLSGTRKPNRIRTDRGIEFRI